MNTPVRRLASMSLLLVASLTTAAIAQPGATEPLPPGAEELPPPPPPSGEIVTIQPDAAPGQPPPPPVRAVVAPLNEDWGNVSHINGHPVKVGERGDYLYKWKKTNIATNPIGWMFGFYGLSLSHALGDHIALRGDANVFNIDDQQGYEFGLSMPIYFRRVYSGPFIEPGLVVRDFDTSSCTSDYDYDYDCDSQSVGPEMLFGWHWTFDSGANVALAFGAMRNVNSNSDYTDVQPAGYFRIGYAY